MYTLLTVRSGKTGVEIILGYGHSPALIRMVDIQYDKGETDSTNRFPLYE
jgi:hypothetical protein